MAYDFPASPTDGQVVTLGTTRWQWSAAQGVWLMQSGNIGPTGPTGPAGPTGPQGADGAPGPTGGLLIEIGDTAPALPADRSMWFETDTGALWLRYPDPTGEKHWLQVNASMILPPADGGEYVMVNGLWRLKSQSYDLTGLSLIDIPVPAAAKMAKLAISAKAGVTGNLLLRWSVDGTTFPAGATDYTVAGSFHQSGSGGYGTQASANLNHWILTPVADNLAIWHTVDLIMTLRKGTGVFTGKWSGSAFNNTAAQSMVHYHWSGYSNYAWPSDQIKTLRVFPNAGTITQGAVEAEWVY